jgi:hypothetical protein
MFYKYSKDSRSNWVVLLLTSAILWEKDCAFCKENAASNSVRSLPLADRKTPMAFRNLFTDYDSINRRELNIPINYPTHPQAETLVFD